MLVLCVFELFFIQTLSLLAVLWFTNPSLGNMEIPRWLRFHKLLTFVSLRTDIVCLANIDFKSVGVNYQRKILEGCCCIVGHSTEVKIGVGHVTSPEHYGNMSFSNFVKSKTQTTNGKWRRIYVQSFWTHYLKMFGFRGLSRFHHRKIPFWGKALGEDDCFGTKKIANYSNKFHNNSKICLI